MQRKEPPTFRKEGISRDHPSLPAPSLSIPPWFSPIQLPSFPPFNKVPPSCILQMYKLCVANGSVCWVCHSVLPLAWKGRKEKEQVQQLLAGVLRTDTISEHQPQTSALSGCDGSTKTRRLHRCVWAPIKNQILVQTTRVLRHHLLAAGLPSAAWRVCSVPPAYSIRMEIFYHSVSSVCGQHQRKTMIHWFLTQSHWPEVQTL